MVSLRARAKDVAYRTGAIGAYHARRNAAALTAVMFHRVLPREDILGSGADPHYTVTPQFLADCVGFLRKHYTIVGLQDVLSSRRRAAPLPANAALITFDDGWYDNLRHAAPVLKGVPWTVFVCSDALRQPDCWWQEALLWAVRSGTATDERLWQLCGGKPDAGDMDPAHALLLAFARLPAGARQTALAPYVAALCKAPAQRMMLAPADLAVLKRDGADIGAHGSSHLPLSLLGEGEAEADLRAARDLVTAWTDAKSAPAMSFPHGRYDERICAMARELGYPLLFSSDPVLNRCEDGWLDGDLLGRIAIDMHDVGDENGKLDPARLATWLFLREIRTPAGAR